MRTMNDFDPYAFTVHTERVVIDGDLYFKTTVYELPNVEVYEQTAAEAYDNIIQVIVDLHESAMKEGRPFPVPEARMDDEYSGRVTLRMGKDLHRRLDLQAKRNGTTLNAEIVAQLSAESSVQEFVTLLTGEWRQLLTKSKSRHGPSEFDFWSRQAVDVIVPGTNFGEHLDMLKVGGTAVIMEVKNTAHCERVNVEKYLDPYSASIPLLAAVGKSKVTSGAH